MYTTTRKSYQVPEKVEKNIFDQFFYDVSNVLAKTDHISGKFQNFVTNHPKMIS